MNHDSGAGVASSPPRGFRPGASSWDAMRARQRGDHGAEIPTCRKCQRVSVFDPCRSCMSPAELEHLPPAPQS